MHSGIRRVLRLSCGLLVLTSFLALVSTSAYNVTIMAIPCLLLLAAPVGEQLDARFKSYRRLTTLCTAAFTVTIPALTGILGLLGAVVVLVGFILAHKLVHQKAGKDYYQLFLMCFFLLVAACPNNPDALIAVAIGLFVVSAVCAMVALQLHIESTRAGKGGVADIVSQDGVAATTTPSTTGLFDSGLLGSTTLLCLGCLLLTVGFFLVMPRVEAGVFGTSNALSQAVTGVPDTVEISEGGVLTPDTTAVMRVEFPDEPGGKYIGDMHWRVAAKDQYARALWDRIGVSTDLGDSLPPLDLKRPEKDHVIRTPRRGKRTVRQMVYLDEVPSDGIPCLPMPLSVKSWGASIAWNERAGDLSVSVVGGREAGLQYEIISEIDEFTPEQLRQAPENYEEEMSRADYFVLTQHQLYETTPPLVQKIVAGQTNTYDRVTAIQNWLQSSDFSYTLDRPELPKTYTIDFFIHDVKRGHCELFASAMALMVRSLGIPTRVVSGFRGGQWSSRDNGYIIRNDMAHLWVEVYFLDHGWVAFDPSPMSQEPAPDLATSFSSTVSRYILKAKMTWYRDVLGYSGKITWSDIGAFAPWRKDDADVSESGEAGSSGSADAARSIPWWFVPGCIVVLIVGTVFFVARRRNRTITSLSEDQERALRLFHGLTKRLRKLGVDCTGKTAGEIAGACAEGHLPHSQAAQELLRAYNDVRFGGRPLGRVLFTELTALMRTVRARRA